MLIDSYGRKIDYIRISITDRCNLSCIYCRSFVKKSHFDILRIEEILKLINIFVSMGIGNIRITGGEPLIRKGVSEFFLEIKKIRIKSLSLTTNGIFLSNYLSKLKEASFSQINVSLDSLVKKKYKEITGYDGMENVISGIQQAKKEGFVVKVNVVVMKGINDNEIMDFIRFSEANGVIVRFIEFMPIGNVNWKKFFIPLDNCFNRVKIEPFDGIQGSGPARYYKVDGAIIGLISAMSKPFCHFCNKIRLTADGKIRLCLGDNSEIDIKTPIRDGASNSEIKKLIISALKNKPWKWKFENQSYPMSAIGG